MERAMFNHKALRNYIVGSAIVWFGILLSTAVLLGGTEEFAGMFIILSGGAVWFVLLVPGWLRTFVDSSHNHAESDVRSNSGDDVTF